jgi:uncharacterized membrane protein
MDVKVTMYRKTPLKEPRQPVRMLALSDGLFATVFTVLVLDLRIPEALSADGGEASSLVKWLGPHLFSYLLTFLVGGTYWIAHHRDLDQVIDYDRSLLGYNLLFLLFVGLFPFTTAAVSAGSFRGSEFALYWSIYAINMALAGVMLGLTWTYAVSHHLVTAEMTRPQSRHIAVRQLVTPAVFLLSVLAECLFPQAYPGPYILLVIPVALWGVDRKFAEVDSHGLPTPLSRSEILWRAGRILPWLLMIGLAVWASTL